MKLIKYCYNMYWHLFDELADPRIKTLPLMGHPFTLILIFCLYLKLVCHWGPQFMENRKPYNIKSLLIAYNAIQILCSASIAILLFWFSFVKEGYNLFCEPVHQTNDLPTNIITYTLYFYFIVKVVDLLDTIFFVLRKKWAHISFLHLYHHAGMIMSIWSGIKFVPGGTSVVLAMTNSTVHTVMYSYYLRTIIMNDAGSIWWKKYITQMQIAQFLLFSVCYFVPIVYSCGYSKVAAAIVWTQDIFFLSMFLDFYYKTYLRKNRQQPQEIKSKDINHNNTTTVVN